MEEGYELDLIYITERIIAVSFPTICSEETYLHNLQDVTQMLKSKHGDNYLVLNLSEKKYELTKLNPKILDVGWPDLHAPPLNKICTICKAMESWLNSNCLHVVVIHCQGGKGRIGVVISSYMHFTNVSASADQALDRFAMKKFFDDKVSALMLPSQKRYVQFLSGLLSGSVKMNSAPLFLHYVILHGIPNFDVDGGCRPFLKLYQAMQPIYTSGVYMGPENQGRVFIAIEPPQLLKGDIMLKCYHKKYQSGTRDIIFHLQFHTGAVQSYGLVYGKEDLDNANIDDRFPICGKVELVFSGSPGKIQGCETLQNGHGVIVDYNTSDPLIYWDSYENMCPDGEVLHTQGPVDGSLYAKVKKKSSSDASISSGAQGVTTSSPDHSDHTLSVSSDSGHSTASVRTEKTEERPPPGAKRILSPEEKDELDQLLSGFGLENSVSPFKDMTDSQSKYGGTRHVVPIQVHVNGDIKHRDRETDILDDEMPSHDFHSVDSIGTLSSSDGQHSNHLRNFSCHKSSQNSLLSDGFGSSNGEEQDYHLAPELEISVDPRYEQLFGSIESKQSQQLLRNLSVSTQSQVYNPSTYLTHTWVQQQQMVIAHQYTYSPENEVKIGTHGMVDNMVNPQSQATIPDTPARESSSQDAVQRGLGNVASSNKVTHHSVPEESKSRLVCEKNTNDLNLGFSTGIEARSLPSSPTLDIDQSIEQLNKLILELDPTFEPIPTHINSIGRDTSQLNGFAGTEIVVGGLEKNPGLHGKTVAIARNLFQQGSQEDGIIESRSRNLSLRQYDNDTPTQSLNNKCRWIKSSPTDDPESSFIPKGEIKEIGVVSYQRDVDKRDVSIFLPTKKENETVPVTPAFPVLPETPYGKTHLHYEQPSPSSYHSCIPSETFRTVLEPRGYTEGLNCSDVMSDTPAGLSPTLLRTDVQTGPSCQRIAACTVSNNSSFLRGESPVSEHIWQQNSSKSFLMSQFSGMSKSLGSYLMSPEFSVPAQDGSQLSPLQTKELHTPSFSHVERSSVGEQQDPGGSNSTQAFLGYSEAVTNSNQSFGEKSPAFVANANSSFKTVKSPEDSGFLSHSFLMSVPGHNSQNNTDQQNEGMTSHSQPPLPEKKRTSEGDRSFGSVSPSSSGFSSPHSGSTISIPFPNVLPDFSKVVNTSQLPEDASDKHVTVKFVQDTSRFWYKPEISREQAIAALKDKEPGSFIVRDSHSFRGAYGIAMKVAIPPPSVLQLNKKVDLSNELVRHFLIECTHKGVRLKGCPNEPYFGSLTALVYQHSITPLALPCKLLIPDRDPLEEISEASPQSSANSATELLKQGAACNVWYLNSVELESLTGYQAVQKALSLTLSQEPPPISTVVHFKVSAQGITLTDNQRKLFFRRHYPVNTVIFCALDPQDRKWMKDGPPAKVFGFVARKQGSATDNVCHLFAEHDPEQPASAIVNFVSKVMIGSQKKN